MTTAFRQLGVTFLLEALLHHLDPNIEGSRMRASFAIVVAGTISLIWVIAENQNDERKMGSNMLVVLVVTFVLLLYNRLAFNAFSA